MPACLIASSNKNLNAQLVPVPDVVEGEKAADACDSLVDRDDITSARYMKDSKPGPTIAELLVEAPEGPEKMARNPDYPGLLFLPSTGQFFVPGTAKEPGGPLEPATQKELDDAFALGQGAEDAAAASLEERFQEEIDLLVSLGATKEEALARVIAASKWAAKPGAAVAATPTETLSAIATAIQAAVPGTTRADAMLTAAVSLGFIPEEGEASIAVKVRQPDGTDITLDVSEEAALRFFQDSTQLTEIERANLAGEALTLHSNLIALRGQDISSMSNQDANLIAVGRLSVDEAQFRLDRVVEAQDTLFKERSEVIKGFVPDSFVKIRPGGQEVAEFRFPQIIEQLKRAGAGAFDIEQFDVGIVRIDPEQRAREVLEATPPPAVSGAAAAAVGVTGDVLAKMREAGVPLPEVPDETEVP
jgi:hypothetical protein